MRQEVKQQQLELLHPRGRKPEKSEQAFRTISEVADLLDTPAHVLRFWESKFSQIKPMKRGGGRRYYRPEDVALLRGIRELLYVDGMTIKGVQKVLREQGHRHVAGLSETAVAQQEPEATTSVSHTVARLEELRNRLRSD
jgi:DNA-binding transcriptional MerR regulator